VAVPQQVVILRESGVSSTPLPIASIVDVSGILDRPVKPGDDSEIRISNSHNNRHCEPTGRAKARPMTGSAKQSIARQA
jgi:hypothetical protein